MQFISLLWYFRKLQGLYFLELYGETKIFIQSCEHCQWRGINVLVVDMSESPMKSWWFKSRGAGGGAGDELNNWKFYTGRLCSKVQTLTLLYYHFFIKKGTYNVPLSYTFHSKWYLFYILTEWLWLNFLKCWITVRGFTLGNILKIAVAFLQLQQKVKPFSTVYMYLLRQLQQQQKNARNICCGARYIRQSFLQLALRQNYEWSCRKCCLVL